MGNNHKNVKRFDLLDTPSYFLTHDLLKDGFGSANDGDRCWFIAQINCHFQSWNISIYSQLRQVGSGSITQNCTATTHNYKTWHGSKCLFTHIKINIFCIWGQNIKGYTTVTSSYIVLTNEWCSNDDDMLVFRLWRNRVRVFHSSKRKDVFQVVILNKAALSRSKTSQLRWAHTRF